MKLYAQIPHCDKLTILLSTNPHTSMYLVSSPATTTTTLSKIAPSPTRSTIILSHQLPIVLVVSKVQARGMYSKSVDAGNILLGRPNRYHFRMGHEVQVRERRPEVRPIDIRLARALREEQAMAPRAENVHRVVPRQVAQAHWQDRPM